MATTIRLKRVGAKKEASYRIVVTDSREGTSGAAIERLGTYNPRTKPSMIRVNAARTLYWLNEGAEPSDTVRSLLRKTGVWKQFHDGVTAETVEQEIVFVGPPEGERGTSQRPMPIDRAPKAVEEAPAAREAPAAEEPVSEAEAEPAEDTAEAATDEPAAEAAEEAPADEATEEPVSEAEAEDEADAEEPAAEAAAESVAEAEVAEEAPAEEAPPDEPVAEAAEEAEAEEPVAAATEEAAADPEEAEADDEKE